MVSKEAGMKIRLLPSTFDETGSPTPEQHLTCFLIDDCVAIDAGSLGLGLTATQQSQVQDIIITHAHIDHVATLPIFMDDRFAFLDKPVRVYATEEVINLLERDLFNWSVYPRFSELNNGKSKIMEYSPFRIGAEFEVAHLRVLAVYVHHTVPTVGLIVSDGTTTVAFTSDTGATEDFWRLVNRVPRLAALFIESSFPNALATLARVSGHLTPATLATEVAKLRHHELDILVVHLKPNYRPVLVQELTTLAIPGLQIMLPGQDYHW
jgi:cAMP phosphodiesterase